MGSTLLHRMHSQTNASPSLHSPLPSLSPPIPILILILILLQIPHPPSMTTSLRLMLHYSFLLVHCLISLHTQSGRLSLKALPPMLLLLTTSTSDSIPSHITTPFSVQFPFNISSFLLRAFRWRRCMCGQSMVQTWIRVDGQITPVVLFQMHSPFFHLPLS